MRTRGRSLAALSALMLVLIGVSSLVNIEATPSYASSHREAPLISADPTADDTDLYAFVSPDDRRHRHPDRHLLPRPGPGRRPELLPLRRRRDSTTSTSTTTATPSRTSSTASTSPPPSPTRTCRSTTPADRDRSTSENWNLRQRYTVTRITAEGEEQLAFEGIVPPANIGPTSTPDYDALAEAAIGDVRGDEGLRRPARRSVLGRPRRASSTCSPSASCPASRRRHRRPPAGSTSRRSRCKSRSPI